MTLAQDIAQINVDSELLHQVIHGAAADPNVTTEGGPVPTLAKVLANMGIGQVRGAWVTATVYALGDVVTTGGTSYRCVLAHTAGATFAGDLPTKWVINAAVSTAMQAVVIAATVQAALALLAGGVTADRVLMGDGTAVTLRRVSTDAIQDGAVTTAKLADANASFAGFPRAAFIQSSPSALILNKPF